MTRAEWLAKRDALAAFAEGAPVRTRDDVDRAMVAWHGECPDDPTQPVGWAVRYSGDGLGTVLHGSEASARRQTNGVEFFPLYRHPQPEMVPCGLVRVGGGDTPERFYRAEFEREARIDVSRFGGIMHKLYREVTPL